MPPKKKRQVELREQVATRRSKKARTDQEPTEASFAHDQEQAVDDHVSLDKLADIMINKISERGRVGINKREQQVQSPVTDRSSGVLAMPEEQMEHATSFPSIEVNNTVGESVDKLFNGMPADSNAMPLSQCHTYGLTLSALVPDKIKSQIWDKKYVDLSQLYLIQSRGGIKQDFAVNISNQGPSTVVKVQPKQLQGTDLTIGRWLTALHCYMDVYIQKFPYEVSGLLAYTNLIRDLERSCGQQTFNFYDRSFRSHRQTQKFPWGQMHGELWNKVALMALANSNAVRANVRPGPVVGNRKVCFKFNSARGCDRRQCNLVIMWILFQE